jgi:hypothetical protein
MPNSHQPITIDSFNGLWVRGDFSACPKDHFTDCLNVDYNQSSVICRQALTMDYPGNDGMVRQRVYISNISGTTTVFLLGLDHNGSFFQQEISPVLATNPSALLLNIGTPLYSPPIDFDYVNINGRAYITFSYATVGINPGAASIYMFDGTNFRPAGGTRPSTGAWAITAIAGGATDIGHHSVAVAFESDTGFISSLTFYPPGIDITAGNQIIHNVSLPIGPAGTVARRIYVSLSNSISSVSPTGTQIIPPVFLAIRVADNVTTTVDINPPDSTLLADGTYLFRIFDQIPCGVGIGKYHNRMVIWGFPTETITLRTGGSNFSALTVKLTPNTILFSNVGDPETFDTLNGYVVIDTNEPQAIMSYTGIALELGITACQEYRDICYAFKWTRTIALTDNGNVPATWTPQVIDEGSGAFVNGVMTVLDTGGVNYEYCIICNETGMYTFNGLFVRPEITWKIADLWKIMIMAPGDNTKFYFGKFYPVLDTINKKIYFGAQFPVGTAGGETGFTLLLCDYSNSFIGATAYTAGKNFSDAVKWSVWGFQLASIDPVTFVGWETGGTFKLLVNDNMHGSTYVYNGSSATKETILSPYIQSYLFNNGEDNIIHINSIRCKVSGNSSTPVNFTTTIVNQGDGRSFVNAPVPIILKMGNEPLIWTNFMSQKFYIVSQVPNNGYFDLSKMVAYIKKVYSTPPV